MRVAEPGREVALPGLGPVRTSTLSYRIGGTIRVRDVYAGKRQTRERQRHYFHGTAPDSRIAEEHQTRLKLNPFEPLVEARKSPNAEGVLDAD